MSVNISQSSFKSFISSKTCHLRKWRKQANRLQTAEPDPKGLCPNCQQYKDHRWLGYYSTCTFLWFRSRETTALAEMREPCILEANGSHCGYDTQALPEARSLKQDLDKIQHGLVNTHLIWSYSAPKASEQHASTTQDCPFSTTLILHRSTIQYVTQSFTCWLIQTSDIFIEWSSLNGLNIYNTERDTGRERGVRGADVMINLGTCERTGWDSRAVVSSFKGQLRQRTQ